MRLTPAEVHNVVFKKPSIGKRGYDEDEVDAFLDLVEDELARLIEENNALAGRLAELDATGVSSGAAAPIESPRSTSDAEIESRSESGSGVEAEQMPRSDESSAATVVSGDTHVQAARMLGLAQEMADRLTSEARAEAEQLRLESQAEAERLRSESEAETERLRTQAQTEAERLRAEAEAEAERLRTEAAFEAEARARAAQEQYDQTLASLTGRRAELQKKIDDLRVYEREYRSRLRSWISDQLALVDGEQPDS